MALNTCVSAVAGRGKALEGSGTRKQRQHLSHVGSGTRKQREVTSRWQLSDHNSMLMIRGRLAGGGSVPCCATGLGQRWCSLA